MLDFINAKKSDASFILITVIWALSITASKLLSGHFSVLEKLFLLSVAAVAGGLFSLFMGRIIYFVSRGRIYDVAGANWLMLAASGLALAIAAAR